jgi:YidC/Oxa1 family membrane protein insertase
MMPILSIVTTLTAPLLWLLETIHSVGLTWAWSIIVLTFIVRLALVPLTVKQQQSMRRMTALQPELKKLQAKYKHDRQMLNEKMMEFYRENNTNPFGSCLPILVQIPIFIGLFYLLRSPERFIEPGDDLSFLFGFIPDITTHLKDLPTTTLAILMVIYVSSQVGSMLLMPSTADPRMKYLFAGMPILFAVFIVNQAFPVGLMLYWITTNLWTVGQAAVIRHIFPPPAFVEMQALAKEKKKGDPPPAAAKREPKPKPEATKPTAAPAKPKPKPQTPRAGQPRKTRRPPKPQPKPRGQTDE